MAGRAKTPKNASSTVQLARSWRDPAFPDFLYKPGDDITVDAATLERMQAEPELVTDVVAAG